MKKIVILSLSALLFAACNNTSSQQTVNNNVANTPPMATKNSNDTLVVSSHKTEKTATTSTDSSSMSSQTSSPNQMAVDVSDITAKIDTASKELKAKPNDQNAKNALAEAYFDRAFTLTKAAQYRAALGDFRKGLKLNPDNEEAKAMHDQIIDIFKSIGREPPKEGEEPAPLPFDNKNSTNTKKK